MIRNDKYELLHGWLFWYDADEDLWKAAPQDEFADALETGSSLKILAATSLDELFNFITDEQDIN